MTRGAADSDCQAPNARHDEFAGNAVRLVLANAWELRNFAWMKCHGPARRVAYRRFYSFIARMYRAIAVASASETSELGGMCHGPLPWAPDLILAATSLLACRFPR